MPRWFKYSLNAVRYCHPVLIFLYDEVMCTMLKKFLQGTDRTRVVKKNIIQSFCFKIASIVLSLLIVPLTISYVSPKQYGVWLTISSIVGWIAYFDLGLGHGLRNRYAEAKAKGNIKLVRIYVSTAYAVIGLIFGCVLVAFVFLNSYIDWNDFLKVRDVDIDLFRKLMLILVGSFCFTMFFKVINSIILGDQKTALASGISVAEQLLSLVLIFVLSKTTDSSLLYLAFVTAGIPCLVLFVSSVFLFSSRGFLHYCAPSFKCVDFRQTRKLVGIGVKFFIIQFSLLAIFQVVNIIISRNCGQMAVSQYQLSYKYFSMLYMFAVIILTPYWSAFTEAYTKKDFVWMNDAFKKLNRLSLLALPVLVIMLLGSSLFFKLWISDSIVIPMSLHACTACYVFSMIYAGVQMYMLNGIGKVTVQLLVYVLFAVISIPTMNVLSKTVGVYGILLFLSVVYISQAIVGQIQLKKILNNKANGIWNI